MGTIRLKNKYTYIKMEGLKVCTKCKLQKSLTEFHKNKRSKSGCQAYCKTCNNIIAKELRLKYSSLETKEVEDKKVCCCCKNKKNISEYTKNRCRKDGVDEKCK